MELWLLLAYPLGSNRKPLQGFTSDLAAAFLLLGAVLAVRCSASRAGRGVRVSILQQRPHLLHEVEHC
jgi:hypothetical protein